MQQNNAEALRQRITSINGGTVVDVLHAVMYGARIRTLQEGEPCYYRGEKHIEGWPWPLLEDPPVEPVRRLTRRDYTKAIARSLRRGVSRRQIADYIMKVQREKSSIARAIDELDNIVPL